MYGRSEGELWFHRRYMWPVPPPSTPSVAAPISSSVFIGSNSFSKDGRKIHVGDCALFEQPHESSPFVGLIRRLILGKEDNLSLSVNRLYRPADVKLQKGDSPEATLNEVFYSFHQDEIPAASLLHPCKVAFLRKGVELPSRIPSFVCRRVYDIEKKCLWWLNENRYINEQQEEVDQLLDKTRVEMYGVLQAGGHSPKPLNGPNGTTKLKSRTDNTQSSSSIPSQVKSNKREYGVQSSDSVKRERLSKPDDADSPQLRPENMLKTEIAKFTDKGGLLDFEGVEKLLQLMRPGSGDKKLDLVSQVMLVDVISVTARFDCLTRFIQRRGLHILDEWLHEVHKGKIGDGSPKSSEKSIDEFLFALLRALDLLPVNLLALQTCNIGKSVNHLRSHKNPEVQRKVRILVDMWKKRVEAEMNVIETRSGNRQVSGSSFVDSKISTSQLQPSALKSQHSKPSSGEPIAKSPSPESPGSTKPKPAATTTDSLDMPPVTVKDEKGNTCSPSANNSQSCSSEHGKTVTFCKEDAPTTSGTLIKNSSGVSQSRKSSTVHGSTVMDGQKEQSIERFSSRIKGTPDASFADNINHQRLIVQLPNVSRSPACTANEGSLEEASTTFGKSSPLVHLEKQDHVDRREGGKGDALPMDLCQGKEELVGSDLAKKETVGVSPCDEHIRDGENVERVTEASKGADSTSCGTRKSGRTYEASYSSINALVESCAKLYEANVSVPLGDDVGMNLLASVAAGEMSRSEDSPENTPPLPDDANLRQSFEDGCQNEDTLKVTNGYIKMEQVSSLDNKATSFGCEKTIDLCNGQLDSLVASAQNDIKAPEVKPAAMVPDTPALLSSIDFINAGKGGDGATKNNIVLSDAVTSAKVEKQIKNESEKQEDEEKCEPKASTNSNMVMQKEVIKVEDDEDKKMGSHTEQSEKANLDHDLLQTCEHAQEGTVKTEVLVFGECAPSNKSSEVANGDSSEQPNHMSEMAVKLDFDLNEVLPSDDEIQGEVERSSVPERFSSVHTPSAITVAAATKGPFYPSENLLRGKAELGWKGSAATSAFRPAEPRKVIYVADNLSSKQTRAFLDFDLNVGAVEDVDPSGGGLDLDLNACEESPEVGQLW